VSKDKSKQSHKCPGKVYKSEEKNLFFLYFVFLHAELRLSITSNRSCNQKAFVKREEDVMSFLSCPFLFQFLWLNISAEQEVFQYRANLLYLHKMIYMLLHTMYPKEVFRTSQETLLSSDIALSLL